MRLRGLVTVGWLAMAALPAFAQVELNLPGQKPATPAIAPAAVPKMASPNLSTPSATKTGKPGTPDVLLKDGKPVFDPNDKTGAMTRRDFIKPVEDAFDRMDVNHDGLVTRAEMTSGYEEAAKNNPNMSQGSSEEE